MHVTIFFMYLVLHMHIKIQPQLNRVITKCKEPHNYFVRGWLSISTPNYSNNTVLAVLALGHQLFFELVIRWSTAPPN